MTLGLQQICCCVTMLGNAAVTDLRILFSSYSLLKSQGKIVANECSFTFALWSLGVCAALWKMPRVPRRWDISPLVAQWNKWTGRGFSKRLFSSYKNAKTCEGLRWCFVPATGVERRRCRSSRSCKWYSCPDRTGKLPSLYCSIPTVPWKSELKATLDMSGKQILQNSTFSGVGTPLQKMAVLSFLHFEKT